MKVALINHHHISAYKGGSELYAHQIASGLTELGMDVFYCTAYASSSAKPPYSLMKLPVIHLGKYPAITPRWLKTVRGLSPDIIHTIGSNLSQHLLTTIKDTGLVHSYLAPPNPRGLVKKALARAERKLLDRYDALTTLTDSHHRLFPAHQKNGALMTAKPALKELFLELAVKPTPPANVINALMVARLDSHHYYKGIDVALEAVSRAAQDVQLTIVGSGPLKKRYQQLADRLGIDTKVVFLGKLTDKELLIEYSQAHLYLAPSTSNSEGFGITVIEAMATKTPVITTNVIGQTPVLKKHSLAHLIPPNDPQSLAQALNTFPFDEKILQNAYDYANAHTIQNLVRPINNLYKKII